MSVTIRDLAKATGLSLGTISRALKNQNGLTDSTRTRVFEAAAAMSYDLNRLKLGKIRRIVFLLHRQHNTATTSAFFSSVLQGAEAACKQAGIVLSFVATGPAEPVMEQIRLHQPDAILCAGFFEPEIVYALRTSSKPMVLIDMQLAGFHSINPDHRLGGYLATRHLIQNGRRRIAMLSGPLSHYSIRERVYGFRKALFDSKILANPALEIALPHTGNDAQNVHQAMLSLLEMPVPPDAVFCYNDNAALTAMQSCLKLGIKIPHDIAFVGFDNIELAAKANPPLTSIHVDKAELGRAGVEFLLRDQALIADTDNRDACSDPTVAVAATRPLENRPHCQTLPVHLVMRESSTDELPVTRKNI